VKDFADLAIDYDRLEKKSERDLGKLHRIISYADHQGCRHEFILRYFGDDEAAPSCSVCDNCLASVDTSARSLTEDEVVIVQKALSCVARVNGRFGRGRIAQTLVGSRSKDVLDAGLDRLSTYGLLKEQGEDYVWAVLNALIKAGCIEVSTGQYPTLALTALGHEVMLRKQTVPLTMPAVASAVPSRKREWTKSAETADATPYDAKLFETLKKWRRDRAAKLGVPAYLVFPDRTLEELARVKPQTAAELLEVRGIGPAKARQFGSEALAIIQTAQ
jgi:ATP-dependent DNA helicase RecQ